MSTSAPAPRVDAEAMEEEEAYLFEQSLYQIAAKINALAQKGRIYGQIVLPDTAALDKFRAMSQNGPVPTTVGPDSAPWSERGGLGRAGRGAHQMGGP